jgi:PAS domain S-box-containing protein
MAGIPGWAGALFCATVAFVVSAIAQAQVIRTVDVPLVASSQIQFFPLPSPSTRFPATRITQDDYGFLWLSAADGLRRYDGYEFMRVPDAQDPESIVFVIAESLMRDRSGRIWFGADESLGSYDPATGSFKQYRSPDVSCGTVRIAHQITEDDAGRLWLATDDGLTALDPMTSKATCYQPRDRLDAERRIIATLPARDGNLWITSSAGLYVLDPRAGTVVRHIELETSTGRKFSFTGFPSKPFQDSDGIIWAGLSAGGDLAQIDPASGDIAVYSFRDAPSPSSGVVSIQEDQDGALWLGTNSLGLVKLTKDRRQAVWYQSNPDDPNGLGGDLVHGLFRDREGSLWSTTKGGDVYRFDPRRPVFQSYRLQRVIPQGLGQASVSAAYVEDGDILWIGTDRGLNRVDRSADRVTRIDEPVFGRGVRGIVKDRGGALWVGTRGNGLVRFDPRSATYRAFTHAASDPRTLSYDNVEALWIDRNGTLWIATDYGLNRFDPATEDFQNFSPQKGLTQYRSIAEDPGGALWLATSSHGVHRFDPATGEFTIFEHSPSDPESLPHNRVNSVYVDRAGAVWAATFRGLASLDVREGTFRHYDSRSGLPVDTVLGILEDGNGHLWVTTPAGLSRFDPRAQRFTNFDVSDGLPSDLFSDPVVATSSPNGELLFGYRDGLVGFFADQVIERKLVAPVVLTGFRLSGEPVPPGKDPLEHPIWSASSLELGVRSIFSFDFSALNYMDPARSRYRYRLDGLESDWNETDSSRRSVTYTTLPAGDYTLRVQARTTFQDWNGSGVSLPIRIIPPWYATWYFRSLFAAVVLAVLWLAYQRRIRHLQREFRQLHDMIESIPAMAWTARPNGSDPFVNRQWAEFTGVSGNDSAASGWVGAVHPEDRDAYADKWHASLAAGEPFETEARFRRAGSGEYRWLLARSVPLRDTHGKVVRWYGLLTDIEDRKRIEEERKRLRELETELAHINRVSILGELSASIAHEVSQPLSAVISNGGACLRWLAANVPNIDEAREAASRIVSDGKRAGEVIARIRALTKRESTPRDRLDLNEITREVLALVADEANREHVSIHATSADDLHPVVGDRVQLQQVVLNLVMNSIEAMSAVTGRPRELFVSTANVGSGQVQVTVEDSGPGLDTDTMEKLFEPFFTTKPTGMGMGLSISRSIVESHGGRLWATGKEGPGAAFHFTLMSYKDEGSPS